MSQRDLAAKAPIGFFVHHQGRGHAERCAAIANALIGLRPVTLFCARDDVFPTLDPAVEIVEIPSLFEPQGGEPAGLSQVPTPATLHCAPLGWRAITHAVAMLAAWFDSARPALFITDVSAEIGQLCRIASVPHIAVLQHGNRNDPGHLANYEGAVGLLAPFHRLLEQRDRPAALGRKTFYAPGLGVDPLPEREQARNRLGVGAERELVVAIGGGGGLGMPTAPLTLGARAEPDTRWIVLGQTASEWHETPPGNLELRGWVANAADWIAAADRIVSTCGNTTVHQVMQVDAPWIAIPEWRYFAEQERKAQALSDAGLCASRPTWPSDAGDWLALWDEARTARSRVAECPVDPAAAKGTATWLDQLATNLWLGEGPGLKGVDLPIDERIGQ